MTGGNVVADETHGLAQKYGAMNENGRAVGINGRLFSPADAVGALGYRGASHDEHGLAVAHVVRREVASEDRVGDAQSHRPAFGIERPQREPVHRRVRESRRWFSGRHDFSRHAAEGFVESEWNWSERRKIP